MSKKIKETVNKILVENDLSGDIDIRLKYIPLINDKKVTSVIKNVICDTFGKESLIEFGPAMTAEDFSFFAQKVPSCHLKIGTKSGNIPYSLHQSKYTINEDSLIIGVKVLSEGIIKLSGE